MSLDITKLQCVVNNGLQGLYLYRTDDDKAAIETDGYFDGTYGQCDLRAGDVILVAADMDGTPAMLVYLVSVGGADVTVVKHEDLIE